MTVRDDRGDVKQTTTGFRGDIVDIFSSIRMVLIHLLINLIRRTLNYE